MMMPTKSKRSSHEVEEASLDLKAEAPVKKKAKSEDSKKGEAVGEPEKKQLEVQTEKTAQGDDCSKVDTSGGQATKQDVESGSELSDDEDDKHDDDMCAKRSTFPERLMDLLSNEEAKDAMWWLPSGDSFAIQPKKFSDSILNKYFQGTKLESFTRKMNRWGFKRVAGQRVPPNTVAYYHNLFRKDQPDLLKGMNGGKKKDHDYRDALVRRELNRDLGLLSASQPILPYASSVSPAVSSTHGLLSALDTSNPLLRQQQLRAQIEQDLALQQAMAIINHQQANQHRLNQLASEHLMYQGLGLGSAQLLGVSLPSLSMLPQRATDHLAFATSDPMLALRQEQLRRSGEQHSFLEQLLLLEQQQRAQLNRPEEKDQQANGKRGLGKSDNE